MAALRATCLTLLAVCLALPGCGWRIGAAAPPSQTATFGAPQRVLPASPLAEAACATDLAQPLVGAHFTALADLSLPGELRVLWPGQRVTDEVQPLRLNAQVSESGSLRRVFCG